jgi:outer membrane usher protein
MVPAPAGSINPYGRNIDLTTPVNFRMDSLGEAAVTLTADQHVVVESKSFSDALSDRLNEVGKARLAARINGRDSFDLKDLDGSGIAARYDPSGLSIEVQAIDPVLQSLQSLFKTPTDKDDAPDIQPSRVSAFINLSAVESHVWTGPFSGTRKPAFYFDGAARVGPFVLEGDGQYASKSLFQQEAPYQFDRQYLRLVYDQPNAFRRWTLGDVTPDIRGLQGYVQMGGIGLSRARLRFDQFRPAILQGNRQIILDRDSTVDVYRNGSLYHQFRLAPGAYDLSALPLITGSNDVRIEVRDDAGRVQTLNYQSYLDPIDLAPGDYEYSAYIGRIADRVGLSPTYGGPVAFTGFFRKALRDRPAIGIGVQASSNIQQLTGQTQFIVFGGSRLLLQGGVSHADVGIGYAATVALDKILRRGELSDSLSLQANYTSRRFGGLGYDDPDNSSALTLNALYSRGISRELTLLTGASYVKSRGDRDDSYRLYVDGAYRISRRWRVQMGVDYTKYASAIFKRGGLGFNISLTYQPSYRDRAELRHDSSLASTQLSYLHSSVRQIVSIGYGAIADRENDSVNVQGFANYVGNRFDASVSHSTFGTSFRDVTDQQITTARVTTALAFADGIFGLGRRINDSFAILYPHETLRGHDVVAGQSLAQNDYMSRSGSLGGAVNGYLASYITQSIQYDAADPPAGYDIGPGLLRVRPPYHSGYKVRVGTDAFVSAVGTVELPSGAAVPLAAGMMRSLDRPAEKSTSFFTNSAGRFAIQSLRPGGRYRVTIGTGDSFDFTVPEDSTGLVDLKIVRIAPQGE